MGTGWSYEKIKELEKKVEDGFVNVLGTIILKSFVNVVDKLKR